MESELANHPVLEAENPEDSGISDLDSVYAGEGSYTGTLASYATRYTYLGGRRFDAGGQHFAPNDDATSCNRTSIAFSSQATADQGVSHDIFYRLLGNKLFLAPITEKPQRVLDCGTGTGIWAVDFADAFPSAAVIGNDLSPIQPIWVPANCSFEVDDFNEAWGYTSGSFDFVHARDLHGSVANWARWVEESFKVLKPGGWLEVVSSDATLHCDDGTLPEDTPASSWLEETKRLLSEMGMDPVPYTGLKKHMEGAGFDLGTYTQKSFPLPIGTWPKKKEYKTIGAMMLVNMLQGIDGWSVYLWTKRKGISMDLYQELLNEWKRDLKERRHHKYMNVHVTYAQKPQRTATQTSEHIVV